jgi:hypothetical protein
MKKLIQAPLLTLALALSIVSSTAQSTPMSSPQESAWTGYGRPSVPSNSYRRSLNQYRRVRSSVHSGTIPIANRRCDSQPRRVWIPGRWVVRSEKVWVPARVESSWQPPLVETRLLACGKPFQFQINVGFYRTIRHPGYWDQKERRVWEPAHWKLVG